ncbi:protein AGENET DOMAIN (AGD)-CONTAINING P1-like [Pyrus communis]
MDFTPTQEGFRKGDRVEVSSRDYGFIGAYYEATVVEDLGGKYKVEYLSLVDEKDESRQLQGDVDADELRPLPPPPSEQEKNEKFDVLDRVDVHDQDAWWVGTITEVKTEGEKEIYSVYFETLADLCDYSKEQLRFHKD